MSKFPIYLYKETLILYKEVMLKVHKIRKESTPKVPIESCLNFVREIFSLIDLHRFTAKSLTIFSDILTIFIKLLPNVYLHKNCNHDNLQQLMLLLDTELPNIALKTLHKKRTNDEFCTFWEKLNADLANLEVNKPFCHA